MKRAFILGVLLLASSSVRAQEDHRGFFLRMHLGLGYLNSAVKDSTTDLALSGMAGTFSIALGGSVSPGFALFGEVVDSVAVEPTVKNNGVGDTAKNTNYGHVGVGFGASYYFLPANFYLSATALMARLTIQTASGGASLTGNSDWGPGLKLQAGKEWWVSGTWGLGVAAMLMAGSNPAGGGSGSKFGTLSGAVVFSATYN